MTLPDFQGGTHPEFYFYFCLCVLLKVSGHADYTWAQEDLKELFGEERIWRSFGA